MTISNILNGVIGVSGGDSKFLYETLCGLDSKLLGYSGKKKKKAQSNLLIEKRREKCDGEKMEEMQLSPQRREPNDAQDVPGTSCGRNFSLSFVFLQARTLQPLSFRGIF